MRNHSGVIDWDPHGRHHPGHDRRYPIGDVCPTAAGRENWSPRDNGIAHAVEEIVDEINNRLMRVPGYRTLVKALTDELLDV